MKARAMAIPLAGFLLALCGAPAAQSQTGPASAPPPAQTPAPPVAQQTEPTPANLTDEELGGLYMARKDYKEAAAVYRRLADKSPRNASYHNKLGMAYQQLMFLGPAAKSYERAFKVDPTYADAMNNLGTVWYQRKKYGKAIKMYRKAIAVSPDMPVLHSNLGYAYFSAKNYEEAIASFRRALALDPQFFERATSRNSPLMQNRSVEDRGRFYFLLAKSFAQAGNVERCLHYLRKARDEGYASLASVKTDPAFAAVLANPELQELLEPRPAETPRP